MTFIDRVTRTGCVLALAFGAACGSTVSVDSGAGNDSGNSDVLNNDAAMDTGPYDGGTLPDGAPAGCANGGPPCPTGLMCCAGVPYPLQGECNQTCGRVSDRNQKVNIEAVDGDTTLEALAQVPVSAWSYRWEPGVRHVGPMAQDFRATFGLGTDDTTIHPIDENGVTIAAVQALYRRVVRLEQSNASLRDENRSLRRRVDAMRRP